MHFFGSRHRNGARHLIERAAAIVPAGALFANAAPLLEEKRRSCLATCGLNLRDPLFRHRSRTRAALAADDCPVDAAQIGPNHRPEQRFERNEPDGSIDLAQIINAPEIVGALDTCPERHVRQQGSDAVISAMRSGRLVKI
jgi:hypothetical protein